MAISYPLSLPTHTGITSIEFRAINTVAYSRSPFTLAGQAHAYSGEAWEADITLPPMNRDDAEQWIAFLISLRGSVRNIPFERSYGHHSAWHGYFSDDHRVSW